MYVFQKYFIVRICLLLRKYICTVLSRLIKGKKMKRQYLLVEICNRSWNTIQYVTMNSNPVTHVFTLTCTTVVDLIRKSHISQTLFTRIVVDMVLVKDVGSVNIYANIGTAPQPDCYSSSQNVHSNSTCHIFKFCLEFFICFLIFLSSYQNI